MTTVRFLRLVALCTLAAACSGDPETQVLTGHIERDRGALAVRAVSDGAIVAATPVRADGSFTLSLPEDAEYRLEVLTRTGVKNIVTRSGARLTDLVFKVCEPTEPFDVGQLGDPNTEGMCDPNDPNCEPGCGDEPPPPPPPDCGPMDPNCQPGCDPMTDPNCVPPDCQADGTCPPPPGQSCDPNVDPNCKCDEWGNCFPVPCTDPYDPNCGGGGGCDPMDPNCQPPGCDPVTDPNCQCDDWGNCNPVPPGCESMDPNVPGCEPPGDCQADGTCPPCGDPMDPNSCQDPCMFDPASCGCKEEDPNCWPEPQPCEGYNCDPGQGMTPDNIPVDFGCE